MKQTNATSETIDSREKKRSTYLYYQYWKGLKKFNHNDKFCCKECIPRCIIEGWTSGNNDIDNFIKDTIYNAIGYSYPLLLEWVPFDKFEDIKQIEFIHKDFHSGNILNINNSSYISDFGLFGPSNEQRSNNKIYEVLPYIAPEVLNGEPYTLSSDIYSFGVVMTELSSGKPPFHNRKHDISLALRVCNGLRPEFGKGTPEIYKKLAHRCMNANPNQRPTANESDEMLNYWNYLRIMKNMVTKEKRLESYLKEADKELPNISTSYEKNSDAIYASRAFTFNKLSKPINSSFITLNEENIEGWLFIYIKMLIANIK
ncbi:hypothetical protein RclHR1_11870006 [Rhizophagus clarus]|uniref:Protein kinase domain-containing protein n=1 Tax=Rhizophagus clarus TaxID=94130 RepID=A0A2Z6Q6Y2_9GLOM|nr:hypothetical protein RclHR1_11870006 [Rhizophagus clarus]